MSPKTSFISSWPGMCTENEVTEEEVGWDQEEERQEKGETNQK
jgi:hypothetical protein